MLLNRGLVLATRWKRPISVLSVLWFMVTIAAHARFIDLPKIELLTGTAATLAAAIWNGIWWGYLRPQIELRRAVIEQTDPQHG